MKILEKLNLKPEEEELIKKVIYISGGVFILLLFIAGGMNFIEMKKIGGRTKKVSKAKTIQEIDLETFYRQNRDKLLPIDLEAHKSAASETSDSSLRKKLHHLTRIVAVEPDNFEMRLKLAETYIQAGLYQKAEDLFAELMISPDGKVKALPCNIKAMYGLTLFYNNKIEKGHKTLLALANSNNSCSEAFCYLGQVEAALNRTEKNAEDYLKRALELDPNNIEASYQLARYYMNRPDVDSIYYKTARKYLVEIINKEPLNVRAHSRLGMVYYYLEQPSLAEKSYVTSLSLNSNDYNTRFNLGELYYTVFKDSKKALSQFKLALDLNPDHVNANFKSGIIMIENRQYKEAVAFLQRAHENDVSNVRVLLQLGVAFEKLQMDEKALRIYEKILKLDKLNDIALMKLRLLKDKSEG